MSEILTSHSIRKYEIADTQTQRLSTKENKYNPLAERILKGEVMTLR